MMGMQDADVILVRGRGLLARAIRWFQGEPGEPAVFNHVALGFFMSRGRRRDLAAISYAIPPAWVGKPCVIEAHWRVRISRLDDFLLQNPSIVIGRCLGLSPGGQKRIVRLALTFAAQPYSLARLLAQAGEKITGRPMTMRLGPGHIICSALVALPYWVESATCFEGKDWRRCTPDDIDDHLKRSPDWQIWLPAKTETMG
jgi:hypothetical protein